MRKTAEGEINVHSSIRHFTTCVPHMLRKHGVNVATFYLMFSEDRTFFFFLLKVSAFIVLD